MNITTFFPANVTDGDTSTAASTATTFKIANTSQAQTIIAYDDTDIDLAFDLEGSANKAASRVLEPVRKVADISDALAIGRYMHELEQQIPSTKERGIYIKQHMPELAALSSSFRSDCKWLFRISTGKQLQDFLAVTGVEKLTDLKTTHPTVLRRRHRQAMRQA
ncbi:hypothetical protein LAZ40_00720 [Cereibacter sphaeroides]|uniref:hypothetical protein n=1 Tax=Cereibacter sphaeroides TaxID=1063 RepID=UPI001F2E06C6|nr:hypothetical protein [Cereibacter sphaeroides]MCE6957596.1 hypothetical protein [Cereibacter sphaeroides]MCE6971127.1 hypothetical protein [Cereibacter sphaeroides]